MRKEMIRFLTWMRNGTAFCVSWFLVLLLIYNSVYSISTISTGGLIKMVLLVIGGVFLFCAFFTRFFIKSWGFMSRMTCFMVSVSILECVAFYWLGIFVRTGTWIEWIAFMGIVLVLYLVCILIYHGYSRKKGRLYTQALEKYQQQRSVEHER